MSEPRKARANLSFNGKNVTTTLEDYLQDHVFTGMKQITVSPDSADEKGFNRYMDRFVSCIPAEKAAADHFRG